MKGRIIYTIGHSTHQIEKFVSLLHQHSIEEIADVRSVPYSRRHPQFNRDILNEKLKVHDIAYIFLGKELGGRSDDPGCYDNGQLKYRLLAKTPLFRSGIKRLLDGSTRNKIALMCAEKDPLNCHRAILVARELAEIGVDIRHILDNGQLETHDMTMKHLSKQPDMFDVAR